jgi:hypothetical protein
VSATHPRITALPLLTIAGLLLGTILVLVLLSGKRGHGSNVIGLSHDCQQQAAEFWKERSSVRDAADSYQSHYNQQRRQCLVDMSSKRQEGDAVSVYDQIVNCGNGAFIASRIMKPGMGGRRDHVIIMGAPVPIAHEEAARAWFNDLMTK